MVAYVPELNEQDLKKVILALQQVAAGRSNATGTVTLSTAAFTVVAPTRAGTVSAASITASGLALPASQPILTALTIEASSALSTGGLYISTVAKDTFTITHTVSSSTSRTFAYAILG